MTVYILKVNLFAIFITQNKRFNKKRKFKILKIIKNLIKYIFKIVKNRGSG